MFVGKNLRNGDEANLYFQDAGSYRSGIRFESGANDENTTFYVEQEDEIKHIFEFEHAVDILLSCSLRRRRLK